MVGPSRSTAIFVESTPIAPLPAPQAVSGTGRAVQPQQIPGVNAPVIVGCQSGCSNGAAGNGVGGPPSGLRLLGTTVEKVQDYGRGAYSRAIGGLRILLTPPAGRR